MNNKRVNIAIGLGILCIFALLVFLVSPSEPKNDDDLFDIEDTRTALGDLTLNNGPVFYINTVGEIQDHPFSEGTTIRALGFNSPDDGFMSEYKVVSTYDKIPDGYAAISLINGNTAVIAESKTNLAFVSQFGAVGDSTTDNALALQKAFDSDYSTIVFAPGEYRVNKSITMKNGNKTILGIGDSVIFTDAQYNDPREWFITISANNVVLQDMALEMRGRSTNRYITQLGIMNASNVAVDYCNFSTLPIDKYTSFNIDAYTGWENIRIDNCNLSIMSDGDYGSNIMLRDFSSKGSRGAQITNNTTSKRCHDEILWIYGEKVELSDILVANNTFTMVDGILSSSTPIVVTISSNSSTVRNIEISNNTIIADASHSLFNIANAYDVLIANNELVFNKVGSAVGDVINTAASLGVTSNTGTSLNTGNVVVERNNITVNGVGTTTNLLFNVAGVVRNNNVTVNGNIKTLVSRRVVGFENNEVTVNGNITTALADNAYSMTNNNITVNGTASIIVQFMSTTMTRDAQYVGNQIYVRDGKAASNEMLLMVNQVTMNDKIVSFVSNEIVCGTAEYAQHMNGGLAVTSNPLATSMTGNSVKAVSTAKNRQVYYMSLRDTTQQYVMFSDNTIFGYQTLYSEKPKPTSTTTRDISRHASDPVRLNDRGVSETFSATVIDAANKAVNTLRDSTYVANSVWSNNSVVSVN